MKRYTQDGFTSVIHGKHWHEETAGDGVAGAAIRARAAIWSSTTRPKRASCATTSAAGAIARRFPGATLQDGPSPGFDPDVDLDRIGLANQTTMLMSESLEIGEMFRAAMLERYGEARDLPDGIAHSTRSAARRRIVRTPSSACCSDERLDLMIVIGGYNSSNTCNLAHICADQVPTYHIAEPGLPGVNRTRSDTSRLDRRAKQRNDGLAGRHRTDQPWASRPAPPRLTISSSRSFGGWTFANADPTRVILSRRRGFRGRRAALSPISSFSALSLTR